MKLISLIIIFITQSCLLFGQKFQIYTGTNLSYGEKKEYYKDNSISSRPLDPDFTFLFGYKMIHNYNKFNFAYGVEIGQNNVNNFIADSVYINLPENIKLMPNLKLTYLNLPFNISYNANSSFGFYIGYTFQYIIHKNQSFIYIKNFSSFEFNSAYYKFQHGLNAGITWTVKQFDFSLRNTIYLTPIFDTKNKIVFSDIALWGELERKKMNFGFVSFLIGYKI